ncbi:MAG TPA: phosphodiester glycosidase family protein [Gaiellaceae bacterium]
MLRRAAIAVLAAAAFAAPAHAQPTQLFPGVTYEKTVEFTPHGAVVLHVLTAPRPGDQNGLFQLGPVLGRGSIMGGTERLTQIERDVSAQATVAGVDGGAFSPTDGRPTGIYLQNGVLLHPPVGSRSSVGVDAAGGLHVDRVRFFGTWQGTGQRRPLAGMNDRPTPGSVMLFTPAYGAKVPAVAGAAEVVLEPFPATTPNVELRAPVVATGSGGGETIPADGAVLMATGATAAKLQAEAPVGTTISSRLILQPAWTDVAAGVGGGPLLVKNRRPVFRTTEDFTNDQVTARAPRAAVGQLADGRVLLVAVDGRQPGYSVGLTSFELAQALVELGAVTASALDSGDDVGMAFDGTLLSRPSGAGEQPVKEGFLVQYFGVYAPQPPLALLTGESGKTQQVLAYKIVRPSAVNAQLVGPDGVARPLEAGVQHDPGTYTFTYSSFDKEGTWHWNVVATDDLGRQSTIDRTFRYDTTLRGLTVAAPKGKAIVRFTLARPATVKVQVETTGGIVIRTLPPAPLGAGAQAITWDGRLPLGTRAYGGTYVAHVFVTSDVGTSDLALPFRFTR